MSTFEEDQKEAQKRAEEAYERIVMIHFWRNTIKITIGLIAGIFLISLIWFLFN